MDLFGKKKLKENIEKLEEEKKELEKKLENEKEEKKSFRKRWRKEKERYKDAVSDKQEAEKKINRLEDKLESLKDRLGGKETAEKTSVLKKKLGVSKALRYLESISEINFGDKHALTVYRESGEGILKEEGTEMFLHEPLGFKSVFLTPLHISSSEYVSKSFAVSDLLDAVRKRFLFIHVSAGGSGIGMFEDADLVEGKVVRSEVKSKHKKGGYSQKRFERLREQQIGNHMDEVEEVLEEFLEKGFEKVVLTGSEMDELDHDIVQGDVLHTNSGQGSIKTEGDLERSFESALGVFHARLKDEDADRYASEFRS